MFAVKLFRINSGSENVNQTLLLPYNVLALKQECALLSLARQQFCFHPIESSGEDVCKYPDFHIHKTSQAWKAALSAISFLFCGLPQFKSQIYFTTDIFLVGRGAKETA